jgi:two-component system sensor histidine kinase AgrC
MSIKNKEPCQINSSPYLTQTNKENYLQIQLELYLKKNEELFKEFRDFRHQMMNMLHGISGFIELEDWNGLKDYFFQVIKKIKAVDPNLSAIEKINNPDLKTLLTKKYQKACHSNISFKILTDKNTFKENENFWRVPLIDLIDKILDQALDEAAAVNNKKVSLYFLLNTNSAHTIIENTYQEKPQNLCSKETSSLLSKNPEIFYHVYKQKQTIVRHLIQPVERQ